MPGESPPPDLPYTDEQLREFVEREVAREGTRRRPRFYAVTGSHLHGFATADSDVDLRGFHTVPAEAYAALDRPEREVTVNADGVTEGVEVPPDVEVRSHELRAFGELLYDANFGVVELVLEAPAVVNGVPLELDALRSLVRERLPMNVPHSYLGMAKSNYYKHLDPEKAEGYDPRPKKFLYVIRGLLGAAYVLETGDVEADVLALAEAVDAGDPALVRDLIDRRRSAGDPELDGATADRARAAIADLFNAVDPPGPPEKAGYRAAIDEWMRKVRL